VCPAFILAPSSVENSWWRRFSTRDTKREYRFDVTQNASGRIRTPKVVLNQLRGNPIEVEGSKIENRLLITFKLKFGPSSFLLELMYFERLIQNA